MVIQSAWCTKDDMRTVLLEYTMFVHRGTSAIAGLRTDASTHAFQDLIRLHSQFTTWHHDQSLHLVALRVKHLDEGQQISQSLSRSRWRQHHHVIPTPQDSLLRFLLHSVQRIDTQLFQYLIYYYVFHFVDKGTKNSEIFCSSEKKM